MTMTPESYTALALQLSCHAVNHCASVDEARQRMERSLEHVAYRVRGSRLFLQTFGGRGPHLVVLPEYFLTSFPMGESIPEWQEKACIAVDGPEYEALQRIARDNGIYLSGNAYELDPHFPDLYFQASFIIDDSGDVVLRYRRLVSMFAPTPHDVLDAYLDRYGDDSLFPVVDTTLGRLACVASEEILYPEITRALALRGAEVICHSSSETSSVQTTPKNVAKQARAYENMVYVVSANSAGIRDIALPEFCVDGHSQVVDFRGKVLAECSFNESLNGHADIHIAQLREARARPAMTNLLARQRLELFASTYGGEAVHPANGLLKDGKVQVPDRSWFVDNQARVIRSLQERGVI
ncbi:MAG: nitrilase-related carbon-nitrogen hydrolase [Gammaproteobacteria bacterium]